MSDVPGNSPLESRLPDDRAYWDALAERIVAGAEPILRERRDGEAWWQPLARWSPAIAVAAAAAVLLVALVGPPQAASSHRDSLAELLAPQDPVGRAVVTGAAASEISAMLMVESGGSP